MLQTDSVWLIHVFDLQLHDLQNIWSKAVNREVNRFNLIAKIMRTEFNHAVSRCDWFNDASPVSQSAERAIKSITT